MCVVAYGFEEEEEEEDERTFKQARNILEAAPEAVEKTEEIKSSSPLFDRFHTCLCAG